MCHKSTTTGVHSVARQAKKTLELARCGGCRAPDTRAIVATMVNEIIGLHARTAWGRKHSSQEQEGAHLGIGRIFEARLQAVIINM